MLLVWTLENIQTKADITQQYAEHQYSAADQLGRWKRPAQQLTQMPRSSNFRPQDLPYSDLNSIYERRFFWLLVWLEFGNGRIWGNFFRTAGHHLFMTVQGHKHQLNNFFCFVTCGVGASPDSLQPREKWRSKFPLTFWDVGDSAFYISWTRNPRRGFILPFMW